MEFIDISTDADAEAAFSSCLGCQTVEAVDAQSQELEIRKQWHAEREHMGLKAKVLKVDGAAVGRCHYGPIEISPLVGHDITVILCLHVHMHERPLGDQRGHGYGRAIWSPNTARSGCRRAIGGKAHFGSSPKARRHNNEQESQ